MHQKASARYATDAKGVGPAPGFDVISKVFPGVEMSSGWRSEKHNREVGGVPNSTHLGNTPGVQGYDIPVQPGMTVQQAAQKIEEANPGVRVVETLQHRAKKPDGTQGGLHWHFALQNVAGKAATAPSSKAPKAVTASQMKMLTKLLDGYFEKRAFPVGDDARNAILGRVVSSFRASGNPVDAVYGTINAMAGEHRQKTARAAAQAEAEKGAKINARLTKSDAKPLGARQAPDGNWYVPIGKNADGSPRYGRVD